MITRGRHELAARRPKAGFSLISVLVAIVLLSVGMLSISQVLTQSVSMQTIMSMRMTALDVARSYMEEVRSRDPVTLGSEAVVTVNDRGAVDATGVFTRELTVKSVALHLNEVTVIVTTRRSTPIVLVTWVYDGEY